MACTRFLSHSHALPAAPNVRHLVLTGFSTA